MPYTNFPYGVRSFGVPLVPSAAGKLVGFGGKGTVSSVAGTSPGPGSQVFFVNSALPSAADAADHGTTPLAPFKTINFAVTRCLANNGDVIYVGPKHVETVNAAAAMTVGVAGVTILGIGNGLTDMPTVNYTTVTSATVTIPAAGCYIAGLRWQNSINARVDGIVVSAADCTLMDNVFTDDTGASSLISVRTTAAANRLRMYNTRVQFSENTGAARTEFLRLVGGADVVVANMFAGAGANYSTAIINNITTAVANLVLVDLALSNATSGTALTLFASTSGMIDRATLQSTGSQIAVFPTTANGFVVGNDVMLGSASANSSSMSATPGATFSYQKAFTSSSLTTAAQTFITCTGGSVLIEGIGVETDATGLAGGTNHELRTNNANGLTLLAAETVANLGANKTVDLAAASVTALKAGFILESGKVLQLDNTIAAGTGAGQIFYNIRGRVISGAPTLS